MAEVSSVSAMLLRSQKRTRDMFLANYGQRVPDFEGASKLRFSMKEAAEYGLVKDMGATATTSAAAAAASGAASAPGSAPLMLQNKHAAPTAAGREAQAQQSGAVVSTAGGTKGGTHIVPRRKLERDAPKPDWHAPWKLMRVISGHGGWVRALAVDPTNQWFVTGNPSPNLTQPSPYS